MEYVVANGVWHIEDHMLILAPWSEQPLDKATMFVKIDFLIQITCLSSERCLSHIGKKLIGYLEDCHILQLREMWKNLYKILPNEGYHSSG